MDRKRLAAFALAFVLASVLGAAACGSTGTLTRATSAEADRSGETAETDAPPVDPDAEPLSEHQIFLNELEEQFGETYSLPDCASGQAVGDFGMADAGESISGVEWEAVVYRIRSTPQAVDPDEALSTLTRVEGAERESGGWTVRDTQGQFLGTVSTFRADDGGWNVSEAGVCVG